LADGQKIRYPNINDKLTDGNGRLLDGMMNAKDKLHPTLKAYQIWADALKPMLTGLLGSPAAVDQAPPPMGDPAAPARELHMDKPLAHATTTPKNLSQ
jgi:hypothetical protein